MVFVHRWHDCLCIKFKKINQKIPEYKKIAREKVNTQKFTALPYTSNEQVEFKLQMQLTLTLPMKYFGMNLTKYVQNVYENPITP